MSNEFWNLWDGLDIGWAPRQDINKVTEEAVRRIQEEAKQAKQVHQHIQQDKQTNAKLATFLSFLITTIKDDALIALLYELFFKTKHPTTGTVYLRKKTNILVIIWFFFPFYLSEAKKDWIHTFYESLLWPTPLNLTWYIDYIKKLSAKYHDNVALDPENLINFLTAMITYFKLYDTQNLPEEEYQKFVLQIKNELYT